MTEHPLGTGNPNPGSELGNFLTLYHMSHFLNDSIWIICKWIKNSDCWEAARIKFSFLFVLQMTKKGQIFYNSPFHRAIASDKMTNYFRKNPLKTYLECHLNELLPSKWNSSSWSEVQPLRLRDISWITVRRADWLTQWSSTGSDVSHIWSIMGGGTEKRQKTKRTIFAQQLHTWLRKWLMNEKMHLSRSLGDPVTVGHFRRVAVAAGTPGEAQQMDPAGAAFTRWLVKSEADWSDQQSVDEEPGVFEITSCFSFLFFKSWPLFSLKMSPIQIASLWEVIMTQKHPCACSSLSLCWCNTLWATGNWDCPASC